jgi:hypothetical protein
VTTTSLEPDLFASVWISLPDRYANRSKVRNNAILFPVTSLEQTQKTPVKVGRPSMSELIPQSAAARVANLASPKMRPMLIIALVFVVLINRLDSFRRGIWFKVHYIIPK